MAYTIISQNNSTTTLSDGVNTITVPSRVNLTSGNFTIVEVNNNMATLEDGDGNVYRDIPCVATLVDAGGGGGAVSSVNGKTGAVVLTAEDVAATPQYSTMPTADSTNVGKIVQFTGATDATYTNGYFYKATGTPVNVPASMIASDILPNDFSISISAADFVSAVGTVYGWDSATIENWLENNTSFTLYYDADNSSIVSVDWDNIFPGMNDPTILACFTVTTTGSYSGQVQVSFTGVYTPAHTEIQNGNWEQIDVQPSSGLQNIATHPTSVYITDRNASTVAQVDYAVVLGQVSGAGYPNAVSEGSVIIGCGAYSLFANYSIAIGKGAVTRGNYAIQLGAGTNSDANTFKVGNNNGNFEMMSANGTIPTARLTNAINKYSTMPTAGADYLGQIAQFTGTTDATYTHGYIYECVSDGATPPTYSWAAVSVQAGGSSLPSQTGNSGKFLTTDGTSPSWSDKPLLNTATGVNSCVVKRGTGTVSGNVATVLNSDFGTQTITNSGFVSIGSNHSSNNLKPGNSTVSIRSGVATGNYSVAIGEGKATGQYSTVINATNCYETGGFSISVGTNCMASALNAIQMGHAASLANGTNSDANTFKVANANGNYEIMSADGTIPTDRYTTTPVSDGTYYPTLTISSGTPTRSWSTISALQNTATGTDSLGLIQTVSGNASVGVLTGAYTLSANNSVAIGYNTQGGENGVTIGSNARIFGSSSNAIAIGNQSYISDSYTIAIGNYAKAQATYAIQLGHGTNNDANTVKIANANGNFEIMDANGNLPADRLASTTGLADGNYRLRLTMASGVPTLSWVAE